MTSRFTELAIDCTDPDALARFWCSVLAPEGNEFCVLAGRRP